MYLYFLLAILIFIFVINYILNKGDITAPTSIVLIGYIFATVSSIILIDYYRVDFSSTTTMVITVGLLFFSVSGILYFKTKKNDNTRKNRMKLASPPLLLTYILILFCLLSSFLFVYNVFKNVGFSMAISDATYKYRLLGYDGTSLQPFYVNQMMKLSKAISYVYLFYFINNIVVSNFKKKNITFLLPAIITSISGFLGGSRSDFLTFVIVALIIYSFINNAKNNWNKKLNFKYIRNSIIIVLIFLASFSFIREFVGRKNTMDPVTYIANYSGGSLILFDLYVRENGIEAISNNFGEETLYTFYNDLNINSNKSPHLEFRYSNNYKLIGNIYTNLRKYLHDFGFYGMCIIQLFTGCLFTSLYLNIKKKISIDNLSFSLIAFSYFYVPIVKSFIQEELISSYLCINSLLMVALMFIIYYITSKIKYSWGNM